MRALKISSLFLVGITIGCVNRAIDPIELVRHDIGPDLERPELSRMPDGTVQQRYLVLLRDDLQADGLLDDTVVDLVLTEDVALERTYRTVLPGFAAPLSDVQVRALRARPEVALVAEDRRVEAVKGPPGSGSTGPARDWALIDVLGAAYGSASASAGAGASLAVLDTGIDTDHEFLPSSTCLQQDNAGTLTNFAGGSGCEDGAGHGTHVAGTIAALPSSGHRGIAPGVALHVAKVLNDQGSGSYSGIAAAIDVAAAAGIDVLNMSLGGPMSGSEGSDPLCMAIAAASLLGTTSVVAAGNEAADAGATSPGGCSSAITVASYDSVGTLSYFTNYGAAVDIAAPGSTIYSTVPYNQSRRNAAKFGTKSGTSMASPHAAAVAALIVAANPGATTAEVKSALSGNSADRGEPTDYSATVALDGVFKLDGRDY